MDNLIIIGGGGHTKSCIDVIEQDGKYNILGIIDDESLIGKSVLGYDIIGSDEDIANFLNHCSNFFLGIGQIKSSKVRREIVCNYKKYDINFPSIISPRAYVSKYASLGEGNIVMHNSFINSDVKIGSFNIFNTNSIVEHDSQIGDFSHISVSSIVCGTVNVGSDCFIGAGSVVANNISINNNIIIGASSFVHKNIIENGIYSGNPLRRCK